MYDRMIYGIAGLTVGIVGAVVLCIVAPIGGVAVLIYMPYHGFRYGSFDRINQKKKRVLEVVR